MAFNLPPPTIRVDAARGSGEKEQPTGEAKPTASWHLQSLNIQTLHLGTYYLDQAPKSIHGKRSFIPPGVLEALFSREYVERRLKVLWPGEPHAVKRDADIIHRSFRDKGDEIFEWLKFQVSDQNLPIYLSGSNHPDRAIQHLTQDWTVRAKKDFNNDQWAINVPTFFRQPHGDIPHYEFDPDVILPFVAPRDGEGGQHPEMSGGYGIVQCIEIPPCCHNFNMLLDNQGQKIINEHGLFALKTMEPNPRSNTPIDMLYNREKTMLRLFGGKHSHIITLLATFTYEEKRCLLFPWAECDLLTFWQSVKPVHDHDHAMWMSEQCLRIVEALHEIHFRKSDNLETHIGQRFGRHGDIKSENILVFKTPGSPPNCGKLVLSDLGFGSIHRDVSKSNVPNIGIPTTLQYRPPECDINRAKITRSFDIWTLGCLFLEMCTWWLGGWDAVDVFKWERMEPSKGNGVYLTGQKSDAFFEVRTYEGSNGHVFLVKPTVSKWLQKLRAHRNCTQYMIDFLDIIEDYMLIVEALPEQGRREKRRMRTPELKREFKKLHENCKHSHYAVAPKRLTGPARVDTGALATLNENAEQMKSARGANLKVHTGRTRSHHQFTEADETAGSMEDPEDFATFGVRH